MASNAQSISDVQETYFHNAVKTGYRRGSILRDRYMMNPDAPGRILTFPKAQRTNMTEATSPAAQIVPAAGNFTEVEAVLRRYKYLRHIDESWAVQVAFDQESTESEMAAQALAEAADDAVTAALKATTFSADYKKSNNDAAFVRNLVIEGRKALERQGVPVSPQNTTIVIGSDMIDSIYKDTFFASRDFTRAYANEQGQVDNRVYMDATFRSIPEGRREAGRLGGLDADKMYMFQRNAIAGGEQLGGTRIRDENSFGGQSIYARLNFGAVNRDEEGVFEGTKA